MGVGGGGGRETFVKTQLCPCRYLHGHTLTPEQPGEPQQEVHMLWMPVPPALTLGEEEDRTWEFLTVVGSSQAEARDCFAEALQLQTRGVLYSVHADSWGQLWAGCGLDVAGPLVLRQALRGSLYYLFSELPQPGTHGSISHGLSPGGLSNGSREECYWGHIFWDQVHPILHRLPRGSCMQRFRALPLHYLRSRPSMGAQDRRASWKRWFLRRRVCRNVVEKSGQS